MLRLTVPGSGRECVRSSTGTDLRGRPAADARCCWAGGRPSCIASNVGTVVWRYGLEIVPPLLTVSADVSWQLAGMSRWAPSVLWQPTDHEKDPDAS